MWKVRYSIPPTVYTGLCTGLYTEPYTVNIAIDKDGVVNDDNVVIDNNDYFNNDEELTKMSTMIVYFYTTTMHKQWKKQIMILPTFVD